MNKNGSVGHRFLIFTTGAAISECGDQAFVVVLSLVLYANGNGINSLAWMWIVRALSRLIFQPFSGVLADRYPKKNVLILTALMQAITSGAVAVFSKSAVTVLIIIILQQILNSTYGPASSGIMPAIVSKQNLRKANSYFRSIMNVCRLSGPFIGAAAFHILGGPAVFLINSITYIILAFCIYSVPVGSLNTKPNSSFWEQMLEGIKYVRASHFLVIMIAIAVFDSMVWRAVEIVLVPATSKLGSQGSTILGSGYSMLTAGSLVGSLIAARAKTLDRPRRLFTLYGALIVPLLAMAIEFNVEIFISSMFFSGLILDLFGVSCLTIVQREVPKEMLGRVFSLQGSASALGAIPVGLIIVPIYNRENSHGVFILCSVFIAISFILAASSYRKREVKL